MNTGAGVISCDPSRHFLAQAITDVAQHLLRKPLNYLGCRSFYRLTISPKDAHSRYNLKLDNMLPTATTLSGQTFNSLGPLTTTFTAPASCATATNNVLLVTDQGKRFFAPDCNIKTSTLGDCFPSGRQIDGQWAQYPGALSAVIGGQINYFSPGIACPSAWTTVGMATKDNIGSLSSSGAFTSTSATLYNGVFVDQYRPNILMKAIAPGETAVLCCPSGWMADGDSCTSTLPSLKFETGCIYEIPPEDYTFLPTTLTVPGSTTATGKIFTLTNTHPASHIMTTSFSPAEKSHWAAVSFVRMVTLLHHASDLPKTPTSSLATSAAANITIAPTGSIPARSGSSTSLTSTSGTHGRVKPFLCFMLGPGLLAAAVACGGLLAFA